MDTNDNELFIQAEIDKNAAGKQEIVYTSRQQFEKMSQQNKELLKLMEHYGYILIIRRLQTSMPINANYNFSKNWRL